jgi:two-component system cell cycle sensor histidine kinase/response regulator CckA
MTKPRDSDVLDRPPGDSGQPVTPGPLAGPTHWATYRELIESLPVGIIVYRHGLVIFANPYLLTLIGWPEQESIIGQSILAVMNRFFVPEERAQGAERLQLAAAGGTLPPVERRLNTPGGELRVAELKTMTVLFESEPAQMTLVRDMTEQRSLERHLQMTERMATLGRVAAGVAHELNNPLAYVLGSLQLLERDLPQLVADLALWHVPVHMEDRKAALLYRAEFALDRVREASEGGGRVQAIMQDLRVFSHPGGQALTPVDLRRPLLSALALAGRDISQKAYLIKDLQDVPPIDGDESRLCQVFLNLLVNASEALPEHADAISEIRVSLYRDGAFAVVELADTGLGIAPEHQATLFEPFFTTKAVGRGTGLGLTICRDIVEQHHGKIEVSSAQGLGTVFRVRLPLSVTVKMPKPVQTPPALEARSQILVIDDEPQVSNILKQVLQKDHDVTEHHSAEQALQEIRNGARYDVILCDLMMPGMTGQAFYAGLGEVDRDQQARVVFVSGGAFTDDASEFLRQLGRPQLDKPFDFTAVRSIVRQVARQDAGAAS